MPGFDGVIDWSVPHGTFDGTIEKVSDGDSLRVLLSTGGKISVRLLGVSAPEVAHPGFQGSRFAADQPGGPQATAALKALLPEGAQVKVVVQSAGAQDKYGRTLGLVFRDGMCANLELFKSGTVQFYYRYRGESPILTDEFISRAEQYRAAARAAARPADPIQILNAPSGSQSVRDNEVLND